MGGKKAEKRASPEMYKCPHDVAACNLSVQRQTVWSKPTGDDGAQKECLCAQHKRSHPKLKQNKILVLTVIKEAFGREAPAFCVCVCVMVKSWLKNAPSRYVPYLE